VSSGGWPQVPAERLAAVLARYRLAGAELRPIASGHINLTFRVVPATGAHAVLQRVSPIFGVELHEDIEAVTAALEAAGLLTPRLLRAEDGELAVRDDEGGIWRLLSYIEGETVERAESPARCRSAGELLGRFHRALLGLRHAFRHRRLGVHDTRRHLEALEAALVARREHRAFAEVEPVAHAILERAGRLVLPDGLPERVVHGDPKISNVIFGPAGEARCLCDLDTVARMPIAVELGDALRSWCSPEGEEVEGPFSLSFASAALEGYLAALGPLPLEELAPIPRTTLVIAVELAARFCRDALEESYFGWDPARFASACAHNLTRARAQLALAGSLEAALPELEAIVRTCAAPGVR
jgi:Ser/Thr protein kinase RdoA (MazF antagonist)